MAILPLASSCGGTVVVATEAATAALLPNKIDFVHKETTVTTLAFGSCHKNKYAAQQQQQQQMLVAGGHDKNASSIWNVMTHVSQPDAFLWTGDAIYPPTRGIAPVALLQQEYQQLLTNTSLGGYASFVKTTPHVFGTWDDHDYGGNDMGQDMPEREARAAAYWDFLGLEPPTPTSSTGGMEEKEEEEAKNNTPRKGLYYSVTLGQGERVVKILFLDTRWHREDHCLVPSLATRLPLGAGLACASRWFTAGLVPETCAQATGPDSLLGREQWDWLTRQLTDDSSPARVHVIVSSIQVLTTNPVMESWGHFPAARERLIRLLDNVSSGAVVLSGDVHYAELSDPYPHQAHHQAWLEVTSSGLTHTCETAIYGFLCEPLLETYNRHRFETRENYYIGKNYGSLVMDWDRGTFVVQVHDAQGAVVLSTGPRPMHRNPVAMDDEEVAPCLNGHLLPLLQTTVLGIAMTYLFFRNMR